MRLLNSAFLREGDVLARPIRNQRGNIMLAAGVKLSSYYIKRLQDSGYDVIFIEDKRLDDVNVNSAVSFKTKEVAFKTLQDVGKYISTGGKKDFPLDELMASIKQMIDDLLTSHDILGSLIDIQSYDTYTFHHSINTTIIALIIGIASGYRENRLLELGMGVMMHDVGKIWIPVSILNKKEKLTDEEFEIIRQHPVYGYEILKKGQDFNLLSAHIALQHQEKWDGSGYPRGLKGAEIHEYGRIAAVADVYEALTSKRVYRKAVPPNVAYEYIIANSGTHFEPQVVRSFSRHIAVYPNGAGVVLSNGQKGNVVKQNRSFPNRPYVRIFYQGEIPLDQPIDYNLAEHPSLMIDKIENS